MSRVIIKTAEEASDKTSHQLSKYIEEVITEKVDQHQGHLETIEENMQYMAGILGRLIERCVLADVGAVKNPRVLDYVIFGSDTNHIKEVRIIKDGSDDDIPF